MARNELRYEANSNGSYGTSNQDNKQEMLINEGNPPEFNSEVLNKTLSLILLQKQLRDY
jgi:hypothetical protein